MATGQYPKLSATKNINMPTPISPIVHFANLLHFVRKMPMRKRMAPNTATGQCPKRSATKNINAPPPISISGHFPTLLNSLPHPNTLFYTNRRLFPTGCFFSHKYNPNHVCSSRSALLIPANSTNIFLGG